MRTFRCIQCGKGTVRPVARSGRRVFFKTMDVAVPNGFAIPTCDVCDEEWLNESQSKALDGVLEQVYGDELCRLAVEQLAKITDAGIEQKRIEHALGLSHGYLSHVKAGRNAPSPMLVAELVLIAKDAKKRLKELEDFWKQRAA